MLRNGTGFPAELFQQANQAGEMNGVVALRGTFVARQGQRLERADVQAPFAWEDGFAGDPLTTPLVRPSDLVPFKPGTDVTFLGSSHAPGREPARRWVASLNVERRFEKRIAVTGPRWWRPAVTKSRLWSLGRRSAEWRLDEPQPASEAAVCWTQAFGGCFAPIDVSGRTDERCADNWIGAGWQGRNLGSTEPVAAPRLESLADPIRDWRRRDHKPEGFGPISPWWELRRRHMGTIDQTWIDTRRPLMPRDFDFSFWQSAPSDCIARPWLRGGEAIELTNLHREHPRLRVVLPEVSMWARLLRRGRSAERYPLLLDGVHFDFRGEADQATLTWRAGFPWPNGTEAVWIEGGLHG